MNRIWQQSDHIKMWSDAVERRTHHNSAKTTWRLAQGSAAPRRHFARLPDQALQALRQAQLQVRERSRSWTQVLPLGQSLERATLHGIRPSGPVRQGLRVSRQLPSTTPDPRRGLRHQPRTPEAQGGVLSHAREGRLSLQFDRSRNRRRPDRQHVGRLAGRRQIPETLFGGERS
jgi:hypothetical protein